MKTHHKIRQIVGTSLHSIPAVLLFAALLSGLPLLPTTVHAATTMTTWNIGVTNGSWTTPGNWSNGIPTGVAGSANIPQIINNTANAVTITGITGTTGRYQINNTGGGSLTLQLGGNLTIVNQSVGTITEGFTNTGANSALAWDLNGYTYSYSFANSNGQSKARNYTIKDTSVGGSGTFSVNTQAGSSAGTVSVQNNVTYLVTAAGNADFRDSSASPGSLPGFTFAKTATLWLAAGAASTNNFFTWSSNTYGNVILGTSGNTNPTAFKLGNANGNVTMNIQGNLTYNANSYFTDDATYTPSIKIAGNFTDVATGGASNYGSKIQIYFVGGATQQQVNVTRAGLASPFFFGDGTTVGNALLKADLSTSGTTRTYAGSTVNLDKYTVTAGTLVIDNSPSTELAYTFGANDAGLFSATDALTLNQFKLRLTYDNSLGDWINGTELKLFSYGTTLTGTPTLAGAVTGLPAGWTYGGLDIHDNAVWLTGLSSVPEPATSLLLIGGVSLLVLRARQKRHI